MAKRQLVDVMRLGVVRAPVVQEPPDHTPRPAVRVDDDSEPFEPADRVDARRRNVRGSPVRKPDVEVAATAFGARGAEVDVRDPRRVLEGVVGPDGAALVARLDGGEDEAVGEDFGEIGLALNVEARDDSVVLGTYSGEGKGISWVALPLTALGPVNWEGFGGGVEYTYLPE